ncbi:VaFE repeat-containing surface-anchored protein [Lachnospiraceae bacterium 56-18]|uniref:VaFE repeat-containing surface-anchored protein n=1 Tax=Sporofaciens sp. JLR.KK001 TaxID=3112621 RepID=UPI002FEE8B31
MLQKAKHLTKRLSAFLLAVLVTAGTCLSGSVPVHAADGTIQYQAGSQIKYGSYSTSRMTFNGSNTAYCVEPLQPTPSSGTYAYTLLSNDSPIRKALYYLNGGYGYDKHVKNQYLSGWSDDNSYVIGHLVVAYIYAGYASDSGAFHGAPQNYIDKSVEIANAIKGLADPPATFKAFIVPGNNDQTLVGSWYQVPYSYIELHKASANAAVSDGNGNYSLKGAEYGIYQGENMVAKLTTDQNGYAKSGELESGNYIVKELKASKGYIIDVTAHNVTVEPEKTSSLNVTEVPQNNPMDLLLQKLDKELKTAQPQGKASLAEAQFTVKFYTEQSDKDPAAGGAKPARTWIFKTDSEGKIKFSKNYLVSGDEFYTQKDGKTPCLPLGTVTVQETKAPTGYLANDTVFVQKITAGGKVETISCYNTSSVEEQVCRGGMKLQKRDFETKKAEPQGGATLENATFTITSLNENPVVVDGKTYTKNQVVMSLTTDSKGSVSTKKDTLPFGHYRADETKAPEGYLNEGKLSVEFDITKNGEIVNLTSEEAAISNQVIRGDLEFVKVADGEQKRLSDIPFSITSVTTGESHTIVTDKNGYASTASKWNKHTHNTNQGKTSEDGIWFGTSKPNDSKGALPYDTYTIEEQRCKANESMDLLKFEITVYKDSVSVDLGTLTDDKIEIGTTALDKNTGTHMSKPEKKVTLIDTVEYSGLKKGQKYQVIGTLMDAETGEAILIDEKPVTAETEFTAKMSSGSVEVTFTFDATSLEGKTTVIFEELHQGGQKLAVHADLEDTDQQISFPEIGTKAKDSDTEENIANADDKVKLTDTIFFKGLVPNLEYVATGRLMDAETEEPLLDGDTPITAQTTFTPEASEGTVDVVFEFNGSSLKGKNTVIYESVTQEEKEVGMHADPEFKDQQMFFPEIGTKAACPETGSQMAPAKKELTIVDTVTYQRLVPGKEYKLTGTLMDQENGEFLLVDGKTVTSELVFTPEATEGSVELSFTFDASALKGKTVVAFESLTYQEKEVAVHADIESEPQSIYIPEIGTTAKDGKDGDQEALAEKETQIIDTVKYKDLVAGGPSYRLVGTLMDKETGKEILIDGKPVTAETTFKPEESSGSVDVTFTFDATELKGHDVVVFEKLFVTVKEDDKERELEVTSHEDIKSKSQTVKLTEVPTEPKEPDISSPVKTGDDAPILLYICIAAGSLLLLIISGLVFYWRRKHQK